MARINIGNAKLVAIGPKKFNHKIIEVLLVAPTKHEVQQAMLRVEAYAKANSVEKLLDLNIDPLPEVLKYSWYKSKRAFWLD